ncbi:MAG: hypothetical protein LC667_17735 [Thioalkalivibrio sp.]|nr:hypothetical protein [Thioalkalivibrio sp.]
MVGDPALNESKQVFEYENPGLEVAVVLKLVRAAQGIQALGVLCRCGLFVDMGVIFRCVLDCNSEVNFLLEGYPNQSGNVRKFLQEFYSKSIDGYLTTNELPVPTKKIHGAAARAMAGGRQDAEAERIVKDLHKTFSGYTHGGYSHIMQMYGGAPGSQSFNILGVPSEAERTRHMQLVAEAYKSVVHSVAFAARAFKTEEVYQAALKCF